MQTRYFSRFLAFVSMGVAAAMLSVAAFAADPTLQEVYKAAEAGNITQAQSMMDQVLRSHPNSAKAHYVRAELFAREARSAEATAELATAERLEPGLPFTNATAVQELKTRIAATAGSKAVKTQSGGGAGYLSNASSGSSGISWGPWIGGGALALAAFMFFRTRNRAQANAMPMQGGTMASYGGGAVAPTPQPYGMPGYGMPGNAPMGNGMGGVGGVGGGGGIGSGIMGGLATGAAVGAGMVAGQALMHRMMDGNGSSSSNGLAGGQNSNAGQGGIFNDISSPQQGEGYDMGGNDFGISDTSSWDDGGGSSGGSDDWS